MSVRVMTAVWAIDLPDSEKIVLLALADCANDEGHCWPSMATLAKKCSKSDRTVQAAIKALVDAGHLSRQENPGRGCNYLVHPRSDFTPEATSPPKPLPKPPKPLRTNRKKPSEPSPSKRETRLPDDFEPVLTDGAKKIVAAWPAGMLEREINQFKDRHTAKGTTFVDWQAAFRTWITNAEKWKKPDGNDRKRGKANGYGPGEYRDPILDDIFTDLAAGMDTSGRA